MGENINFEYTWCDFLTPCPHGKDCCAGDYDCYTCEFYEGNIVLPTVCDSTLDYSKYTKVYKGCLKCKKYDYED